MSPRRTQHIPARRSLARQLLVHTPRQCPPGVPGSLLCVAGTPRSWPLFPSSDRESSPAAFPDREGVPPTTLFHPMPVLPKAQPGPEVRIYDSNTGKLIRTGARGPPAPPSSLPLHQEPSSFRYMAAQPLPPASEGSSSLLLWSVRGMAPVAQREGGWRLQTVTPASTLWERRPHWLSRVLLFFCPLLVPKTETKPYNQLLRCCPGTCMCTPVAAPQSTRSWEHSAEDGQSRAGFEPPPPSPRRLLSAGSTFVALPDPGLPSLFPHRAGAGVVAVAVGRQHREEGKLDWTGRRW